MTRKHKDVKPGTVPEPNAEEQEVVDARDARIRELTRLANMRNDLARHQAAEQQRKFGIGDQG